MRERVFNTERFCLEVKKLKNQRSDTTEEERQFLAVITSKEVPTEEMVSTETLLDMIQNTDKYCSRFVNISLVQSCIRKTCALKNRGGVRRLF